MGVSYKFQVIKFAFRLPADTYSDVINIGLPSLRGRAGGRGRFLFDYEFPSVLNVYSRLEIILIHLSAVKVVGLGVR